MLEVISASKTDQSNTITNKKKSANRRLEMKEKMKETRE
ncbi:uncharacterized, partial [Tachysurus ichikawai]